MNNKISKLILLVEDEDLIAIGERRILERYGYKVIIAHSGEKAIDIFDSNVDIDLILMDINLGSGIDGTEAARQILAKRDIPLIFLSLHTEREIVEKTEGITSYGYIVKNSGETVLIASIKMAFRLFYSKMETYEKEKKLRENKDFLQAIFVNSPVGIFVVDVNESGEYIYTGLNPAHEEIFGLQNDLIMGKPISFLETYKDRGIKEYIENLCNSCFKQRELIKFEKSLASNNKKITLFTQIIPIINEDDKIYRLIGSVLDITDRKLAEEQLKKNETFLKEIQRLAKIGGWEWDMEAKRSIWTDEIYTLCGLEKDFDTSNLEKIASIYHRDYREKIVEAFNNCIEKKEPYDMEVRLDEAYGENRWSRTLAEPVVENGEVVKVRGLFFDITDFKRTEIELRKSKQNLYQILENMPIMMEAFDENSNIILWNRECENITGYTSEEAIGNPDFLNILYPDAEYREKIIKEVIDSGFDFRDKEFTLTCKDGSEKTIRWADISKWIPIEGWFTWAVGVDVTEKKEIEERLKSELLKNKSLLGELQHRVKNSFLMISEMLSLIASYNKSEETISALKEVNLRINAFSEMYNLLFLSESIDQIKLNDYLEKILYTFIGVSKKINFKKELNAIIVNVKLAIPIGISVTELITNSIKHAFNDSDNKKDCEVSLLLRKRGDRGLIEIRDNGEGLPKDFEIKSQTSFGLNLVHSLINQIDGNFIIKNDDGGVQCIIEFPIENIS